VREYESAAAADRLRVWRDSIINSVIDHFYTTVYYADARESLLHPTGPTGPTTPMTQAALMRLERACSFGTADVYMPDQDCSTSAWVSVYSPRCCTNAGVPGRYEPWKCSRKLIKDRRSLSPRFRPFCRRCFNSLGRAELRFWWHEDHHRRSALNASSLYDTSQGPRHENCVSCA